MASAGLLMATVFFDVWKASKKNGSLSSEKRQSLLQLIPPGEVLTLSFLAAIVFPALWIVGLVILVFGVETLYRGFQRKRFAPRKKGAVYICWAVIILLTLLSWIPTRVRRSTLSTCSWGLLSIAKPWSEIALGITIAFIVFYTLIASILATQLFRSTGVDTMERVATTQMVYYLAIATAVFTFFLPFWARITAGIPQGITPMMAMVSINVIGIVVSFFQLLFRSYTEWMTIRYSESSRKYRWKNGLKRQISSPIAIPQDEYSLFDDSIHSTHKDTNTRRGYFNRMDIDKSLPPTPTIRQKPNTDNDTNRKISYSIFPTKASARKPKYPASSIYEDDILLIPPRPAFAAHNRNSSEVSHATVQIGFRLSNLDPRPLSSGMENREPSSAATASRTFSRFLAPPPFSISNPNSNNHISTTSIDVPVTLRSPATERPNVTFPSPTAAVSPPSRLRSSTLPTPSQSITSSGARSPAVYRKLDDLQKLLEVDLQAAQKAAADNEAWPLRDSLPGLLPKSTYRPDE
ncbi:hypothetical protein ZTR_09764 [Talaromyces verruculosus]|nr:hypothetical protein ZTR_09764 [Talaromyces verruculosus]